MQPNPNETPQDNADLPFSNQQLDDYAHGRLTDTDVIESMQRHLMRFPDGQVAMYLQHIQCKAQRILDARDNIYFGRRDKD